MDSNKQTLKAELRELRNREHVLTGLADDRPPANGAEITLAMRKVQEAIMYVEKAIEKAA